jgi:S-adenosyl-L-methionine hydrolase (adenosine-forming)
MRRTRCVTLTTDIGAAYAAQMKAVFAHADPPLTVVDLAHDLTPHAIGEAAFLVRAMAGGFPAGTVHVVVVDPGVGGRRAPLVIATNDGSRLVGPDNGVLFPLAEALGGGRAYRLRPVRDRVGPTFDGRDLFAPAAVRLAHGTPPARLGEPIRARPFHLPEPVRSARAARGEVLHRDRFGNLISNIPSGWVPRRVDRASLRVQGRGTRTVPVARSYEQLGHGRLGVLGSSFGLLEVAVGQGDAARRLRTSVGRRLTLTWGRRD